MCGGGGLWSGVDDRQTPSAVGAPPSDASAPLPDHRCLWQAPPPPSPSHVPQAYPPHPPPHTAPVVSGGQDRTTLCKVSAGVWVSGASWLVAPPQPCLLRGRWTLHRSPFEGQGCDRGCVVPHNGGPGGGGGGAVWAVVHTWHAREIPGAHCTGAGGDGGGGVQQEAHGAFCGTPVSHGTGEGGGGALHQECGRSTVLLWGRMECQSHCPLVRPPRPP